MRKRKQVIIILMMIINIVVVGIFIGKKMDATNDEIVTVTFQEKSITEQSVDIQIQARCIDGYQIIAMQIGDQPRVENVVELDFTATENKDYIVKVYYHSLLSPEELTETFTKKVDCLSNQANNIASVSSETEITNNPGDFELNSIGFITKYTGPTNITKLIIPEKVGDKEVTGIMGELILGSPFLDCKSLKSVEIPNTVTRIADAAFFNCEALISIDIPDSVTKIGRRAFFNCTSLKSVTIPNSVEEINSSAFTDCTSLTTITLPDSITYIDKNTFSRCTALETIEMSNSTRSIGDNAFEGCTALTSITLPNSLISISKSVFNNCTSLTSITIPASVTYINSLAFQNCTSLTSAILPYSLERINNDVFSSAPINNLMIMVDDLEESEIPDNSPILKLNDLNSINIYRIVMDRKIETEYSDIQFYEYKKKSIFLNDIFKDKGIEKYIYTGTNGKNIYNGNDIQIPNDYFDIDVSAEYKLIGTKSDHTKIEADQLLIGEDEKSSDLKIVVTSYKTLIELPITMIPSQFLSLKRESKNTYIEGEKYNPKGLTLTMTYEDGYQDDIIYSEENRSDFIFKYDQLDFSTTQQTITYKGYVINQALTIKDRYEDKILSDTNSFVSIKGKFVENSYLSIEKIKDINKELYKDLEDKNLIVNYEVKVVGEYQGDLIITFHVGNEYRGKKAYIRHLKQDGSIEKYEEIVMGGKIEITVNELSPFVIYVNKDKQDNISNSNEAIIPPIHDNKILPMIDTNNDVHNKVIPNLYIKKPVQEGIITKEYQSIKTGDATSFIGYMLLAVSSLLIISIRKKDS